MYAASMESQVLGQFDLQVQPGSAFHAHQVFVLRHGREIQSGEAIRIYIADLHYYVLHTATKSLIMEDILITK